MAGGVEARYYDGRSSAARAVRLDAGIDGRLRVEGEGVAFTVPLANLRVSPRVGASRRYLELPDGGRLECADNDGVDALLARGGAPAPGWLHRWERRLVWSLAALVLTAGVAWAAIALGVPALAREIAFRLPASAEQAMGRDALATLDRSLLGPTKLPEARRAELQAMFARMAATIPGASAYRLELRAGQRVGANALALPAGIVVFTDELVALAKSDAELEGVLAHEIGHLRARHALRHVLQDSIAALLVAATLGDVTSITSLAGALPALLLQTKYSRDFEREADDFALEWMRAHGRPPAALADVLERMEAKRGGGRKARGDGESMFDYLSTHPATAERAARLRGAGR